MVKKFLLLIAWCLMSAGCWFPGQNRLRWKEVEIRHPIDDFKAILKLLATYEGGLEPESDRVEIRVYDSDVVRAYEGPNWTLYAYPHNWTERMFELRLFAGRTSVSNSTDMVRALYTSYDRDTKKYTVPASDPFSNGLPRIGMCGTWIGDSPETIRLVVQGMRQAEKYRLYASRITIDGFKFGGNDIFLGAIILLASPSLTILIE